MSTGIQEEFLVGREPNAEERELIAWSEEVVKKGLTTLNEALARMVTLLTAVLAGSAALLGSLKIAGPCIAFAVVLLLAALGVSLYGSLPVDTTVDRSDLNAVRAMREEICRCKMCCLKTASSLMVAAFAVLLAGLLIS